MVRIASSLARGGAIVAAGLVVTAGLTVGGALPAYAAGTCSSANPFTAGDPVVDVVGTTSGTSGAVTLAEYLPTTANQATPACTVSLPATNSSGSFELTDGTAAYDGFVNLSADGTELVVTGYTAPTGTTVSSYTGGRTIDLVNQNGVVDSSTSLTDTGTDANGNNFRSADVSSTSSTPFPIWDATHNGIGYTTDGSSSATPLDSDNVHQIQDVAGNLYASNGTGIEEISGLPTSGTQTSTALSFSGQPATNFEPAGFALLSLPGGPSGPNTLYVSDNNNGSSPNSLIEKFSLESGTWVETGTISAPNVQGIAAYASNNTVDVFATDNTSASGTNDGKNTQLVEVTDSTGWEGTLSGSLTPLATVASGSAFKGVALAPYVQPGVSAPEAPWAVALPLGAVVILVGAGFVVRRRQAVPA